jgi:hypothetical protein
VIQVSETLQNRNIVCPEKVTHGERAMPADGKLGGGAHFIGKGLNQLSRIALGKCDRKRHDGQVWFNLLAELG